MDNDLTNLMNVPMLKNMTADIKSILNEARRHTAHAINSAMVAAYWMIGRRIVMEEQQDNEKAYYGEHLLQQ